MRTTVILTAIVIASQTVRCVRRGEPPVASTPAGPQGAIDSLSGGETTTGRYEYVGNKRCRMCHGAQYESWLESAKNHSFDALAAGERSEAKRLAGLDVTKDYRKDPTCLPCHTVGFGRPGGYIVPAEGNGTERRFARARRGAGCESCHGPGSGFVQIMSDVYKNRRPYDPRELAAVGRRPVTQDTCNTCHNQSAICVRPISEEAGGFGHRSRYEVRVEDRSGYHEAFPLKFRRPAGRPTPASADRRADHEPNDESKD